MTDPSRTSQFRRDLLDWFKTNKRDLPWRNSKDAYGIWVSEIMAQQTQIATVIPFWQRWMERFPTVDALASADEQEVLGMWQGLGYYRRARFLHKGAQFVAENGFPKSAAEWEKVPGVGAYTAAAISSISNQEQVALVDGNVERVFARLTGCEERDQPLHRAAWGWAREMVDPESPGDWNEALMEFGATVCTPKRPECGTCPVSAHCEALAQDKVDLLPIPKTRKEVVQLAWSVIVSVTEDEVGLVQAKPGEWWESMWVLPKIDEVTDLPYLGSVSTVVTHHKITIALYRATELSEGATWFKKDSIEDLPIPAPFRRALKLALQNDTPSLF